MRGQRALRRGDLKYVRTSGSTDRLYDLAVDEREQADLSGKRPADLEQLRNAWESVDSTLIPYSS
jgi:arylsulfatase A-like enzyme